MTGADGGICSGVGGMGAGGPIKPLRVCTAGVTGAGATFVTGCLIAWVEECTPFVCWLGRGAGPLEDGLVWFAGTSLFTAGCAVELAFGFAAGSEFRGGR